MFNTLDKLNKKPNSDPENTNNIYYDYYDTPIYYNHFEKNVETSGYIKVLYRNTENINRPNLTFYPELKTFDIKALYIFKKLHDIPEMDFDGELVVEHVSKTNQSGLVYTCFPLKTKTDSVFSYKNPSDFIDEFAPALSQYPLIREVYMINREGRAGLGTGFVSFVAGDAGQRIVRIAGLLPATMPVRLIKTE